MLRFQRRPFPCQCFPKTASPSTPPSSTRTCTSSATTPPASPTSAWRSLSTDRAARAPASQKRPEYGTAGRAGGRTSTSTAQEPLLPPCRAEVGWQRCCELPQTWSKRTNQNHVEVSFYLISRCVTLPRRGGGKEAGTGPEREAHGGLKGFGIAVVLSTLLSSLSFCPRQTLTLPSPRPTLQQRTHLSVWKQPPRQLQSACMRLQPNTPRQRPRSPAVQDFARSLPPDVNES